MQPWEGILDPLCHVDVMEDELKRLPTTKIDSDDNIFTSLVDRTEHGPSKLEFDNNTKLLDGIGEVSKLDPGVMVWESGCRLLGPLLETSTG